jgi:hypothetical protein
MNWHSPYEQIEAFETLISGWGPPVVPTDSQSRTHSNSYARARMALALGKLNFACAVIGLIFINRACRQ